MIIKFETIYDENINIYDINSISEDCDDNIFLEGNDMAVCINNGEDCKIVLCYAKGLVFKDNMIKGDIEIKRCYIEEGDDIK